MTDPRSAVDDVLDEVHEVRRALDARFGHDPQKFLAYVRGYEQQLLRTGCVAAPLPDQQDRSAA